MATTQNPSSQVSHPSERLLPAWAFSVLFHFTAIVLLGLVIEQAPRGAAEEPGRSAGIVLKTSSAAGDLYEGEEDLAESADVAPPVDLLSVLPEDTDAGDASDQVQELAPSPGAGATTSGGQPNASQFTSGGGARRGSPGGSGEASVSVFGVEGTGTKFVYLFDRSSSMEGAPLAAAKRQLIESLASLDSVHQFHIIFFNTKPDAFQNPDGGRRVTFATERNKRLAANYVMGVSANGGTDRLVALREAISFAPDVIFFLTDADDPMSQGELADIARHNRRARAAICVIEFGRLRSPLTGNFLQQLAEQSGGSYGYVNTMTLR